MASAQAHIDVVICTTANARPARTPSYIPFAKQSQYAEDNDRAALIHQNPSSSGFKVTAKQVVPWIQGKRQELQGWRFGVSRSAWLATAVLILNTLITITAVTTFGSQDGIGTSYMVGLNGFIF